MKKDHSFFIAGTLISLLQGIFDGDIDFKTLSQKGDMGLGTINGVDGEMIGFDGVFYRIDAQGIVNIINPETKTPFAVVSRFEPSIHFKISNVNNFNALTQLIDQYITPNLFYMIRIDADFSYIKTRSEYCQAKPYKPLNETMPKLQTVFEFIDISGTLIGCRSPEYCAEINVPGFHFHFLDQQKKTGGHVFELAIKQGNVAIALYRQLEMKLFATPEFDHVDLTADISQATADVEIGGKNK